MTEKELDLFGISYNNAKINSDTPKMAKQKNNRISKQTPVKDQSYDASSIRVLEGLEPVRLRPGMYIGGTDKQALHHLFAEVIDNAMDEAVAGYATKIKVTLEEDGSLIVEDNGRGIPVENHPQIANTSTLEVIMTRLHAGGKFDGKAYETSGGLHGVGISVVNALSDLLEVEVVRDKKLYRQCFSKGLPMQALELVGKVAARSGTTIKFHPDPEIFGQDAKFDAKTLFEMTEAKAYLFGGVTIEWLNKQAANSNIAAKATFYFPNGLQDYLESKLQADKQITNLIFSGHSLERGKAGAVEWAIGWQLFDNINQSYCNTIPTKEGGTHENGLKLALTRSIKTYAEFLNNKRASIITTEDVMNVTSAILSVFIREPAFVGQTKNRLSTPQASKIVDTAIKDKFDHWLANNPQEAKKLLDAILDRADERLKRRQEREVSRKSATRKLRLPGKLADCAQNGAADTELFIVEGDSAGGSAKQARNRAVQAILPLRGKILNVASASRDKFISNQQISDLIQALGTGTGNKYNESELRYDKIIIMTDADVDGAHIASLLITFFYQEMPELIKQGHLYLAVPPLYRISQGGKVAYARDDAHKDVLIKQLFKGKGKIEIGRFKGLGEMRAEQLKETTMDPTKRTLLKVMLDNDNLDNTEQAVYNLMGNKPETRFKFIQENAAFANELDI